MFDSVSVYLLRKCFLPHNVEFSCCLPLIAFTIYHVQTCPVLICLLENLIAFIGFYSSTDLNFAMCLGSGICQELWDQCTTLCKESGKAFSDLLDQKLGEYDISCKVPITRVLKKFLDNSESNLLCQPLYPSIYQSEGPNYLPFCKNLDIKESQLNNPSSWGCLKLSSDKLSKGIMGEVTNFYLLLDSHESKHALHDFVTCVFSTGDCLTDSLWKKASRNLEEYNRKRKSKAG